MLHLKKSVNKGIMLIFTTEKICILINKMNIVRYSIIGIKPKYNLNENLS